jgi:hypothetical protein
MADVDAPENWGVAWDCLAQIEHRCDVCFYGECAWIGHPVPRWWEWLLWAVWA